MMKDDYIDFTTDGSNILERVAEAVGCVDTSCSQLHSIINRLKSERFTADSYTVQQLLQLSTEVDDITNELRKILNGETI